MYKLIKLITDTSAHTENLIKIPKTLNNLNRYAGILPCKGILNIDFYNNVLINDVPEDLTNNYMNASYISVYILCLKRVQNRRIKDFLLLLRDRSLRLFFVFGK